MRTSAINSPEIVLCRPALHKDTGEVMELCSHIWEGGDYIPQVWDEWLADEDGLLGVAEMNARVVGVFKLTKFTEQEWYLEGLRVHPDVQGRGVAAHIHRYVLETWRRMGRGILRLTTASHNIKVHHMCEQSGFVRKGEFIAYRAPVMHEETSNFTPVTVDENQQSLEFVINSPTHALSWGLINLGWVYADPQLNHIQEAINNRKTWWWKGRAGFISIWEDEEEEEHDPWIQLIACSVDQLQELLVDYRRLMGVQGYESAGWIAPNQPGVINCLDKTGFVRSWDISLYVYELVSP